MGTAVGRAQPSAMPVPVAVVRNVGCAFSQVDEPVVEYVESSDGIRDVYDHLTPLLDYLLPKYGQEGKSHLTIGIGCTGGRHRSVAIAEHLAERYRANDDLWIEVTHRDVTKVPERA